MTSVGEDEGVCRLRKGEGECKCEGGSGRNGSENL